MACPYVEGTEYCPRFGGCILVRYGSRLHCRMAELSDGRIPESLEVKR